MGACRQRTVTEAVLVPCTQLLTQISSSSAVPISVYTSEVSKQGSDVPEQAGFMQSMRTEVIVIS